MYLRRHFKLVNTSLSQIDLFDPLMELLTGALTSKSDWTWDSGIAASQ